MVALVKLVTADDVEDTGIAFETGRMQGYAIEKVSDTAKPALGLLHGDPAHKAMHLVATAKEVLG